MKADIKTERVRLVFANTAKEIIMEKGVDSISVRKIADQAGYVIGTLYNYFNSIDELLWLTRSLIIRDIADYMDYGKNPIPESIEDIIVIFQKYAQYYIDNPEVYKFFYFKSLNVSEKKTDTIIDTEDFNVQFLNIWDNLIKMNILESHEALYITKIILYSLHGLLTLTLSDNDQLHKRDINDEIAMTIKQLLTK